MAAGAFLLFPLNLHPDSKFLGQFRLVGMQMKYK